jgi:hypothetical protein
MLTGLPLIGFIAAIRAGFLKARKNGSPHCMRSSWSKATMEASGDLPPRRAAAVRRLLRAANARLIAIDHARWQLKETLRAMSEQLERSEELGKRSG